MIGTTLGNYRITKRLGDGGMGSVFLAVDEMLDREVAIKVLRPDLARQAVLMERFRLEAVALARLHHPRIATLHGLERHGEDLLMVMEYVRGETLEAIVRRSGSVAWARAAELCVGVLDALDHAHDKQVVHRDIKPANIMLSQAGAVKVMDFGIARMLGKSRQTQFGHAVGTPTYMAPEQLRGEEVDGRTDLYAVGAVLFELITGRMAFEAESDYRLMMMQLHDPPPLPSTFVEGVPAAIDAIIQRAMAKKREDRFPNAVAFARALESTIAASDIRSERAPAPATRLGTNTPLGFPGATADHDVGTPETRLAGSGADAIPATRYASASEGQQHVAPATRLAASARTFVSGLEPWQRDWRTWAIAGALLLTAGFTVRALRGPGPIPPIRPDSAALVVADTPRTVASRDTAVQSGPVGGGAPAVPREDASTLIINPPSRLGGGGSTPPATGGGGSAGTGKQTTPPANSGKGTSKSPEPPPKQDTAAPVERRGSEAPAERVESESAARAAISDAISQAAQALSGRNSGSAESLLGGSVGNAWAQLMREGRVSMSPSGSPSVQLNGSRATAEFEAAVNVRSPFGANRRRTARFAADLQRSGGQWRVTSMRPLDSIELK